MSADILCAAAPTQAAADVCRVCWRGRVQPLYPVNAGCRALLRHHWIPAQPGPQPGRRALHASPRSPRGPWVPQRRLVDPSSASSLFLWLDSWLRGGVSICDPAARGSDRSGAVASLPGFGSLPEPGYRASGSSQLPPPRFVLPLLGSPRDPRGIRSRGSVPQSLVSQRLVQCGHFQAEEQRVIRRCGHPKSPPVFW